MADTKHDAELEITLHHAVAGEYEAELRFTSPDSETEIPPVRAPTALDPDELDEHLDDPEAYGAALTAALFDDEALRHLYAQVRATVDASGLTLRVRRLTVGYLLTRFTDAFETQREDTDYGTLSVSWGF